MSKQIHNIHVLRGIACLLVVWVHASPFPANFGTRADAIQFGRWIGFVGVDLFFVLSGFIITHVQSRSGVSEVPGFLLRRAWRIYPVYWAATALSMILIATTGCVVMNWSFSFIEVLEWLLLLPSEEANRFLGPAWTLVFEIQFYAVFGVLLLIPRWTGTLLLTMWGGAVFAAEFLHAKFGSVWFVSFLSPHVLEFLAGVAVARMFRRGWNPDWRVLFAVGSACLLGGGIYNGMTVTPEHVLHVREPFVRVLLFGPACLFLVWSAAAAEATTRWNLSRLLVKISDSSYSTYLTHQTVNMAMIALWIALPVKPWSVLWILTMMCVSIGFGYAFYRLIEAPSQSWLKRRLKPASPVKLALTSPQLPDPVRKAA